MSEIGIVNDILISGEDPEWGRYSLGEYFDR